MQTVQDARLFRLSRMIRAAIMNDEDTVTIEKELGAAAVTLVESYGYTVTVNVGSGTTTISGWAF